MPCEIRRGDIKQADKTLYGLRTFNWFLQDMYLKYSSKSAVVVLKKCTKF